MSRPTRCEPACRHGHGDACPAAASGHWRLCELTDPEGPAYDPRYLAMVAPGAAAGPPAARSFDAEAHRAVLACKVRQSARGCGCDGRRLCHRAGLPILVDLARCLECARRSSPA